MACSCAKPEPALNPRHLGDCVRCAKPIAGKWVVDDNRMAEFFELLGRYNELGDSAIEDFDAFRWHCEHRERWGRDRFKLAYLARDNAAEGLEEGADLAIYACLEYWKMHRGRFDPDVAADLLDAAYHAALAHAALRRAQARRKGSP